MDVVAIILRIVIAMVHPKTRKMVPITRSLIIQRGLLAMQQGHIVNKLMRPTTIDVG